LKPMALPLRDQVLPQRRDRGLGLAEHRRRVDREGRPHRGDVFDRLLQTGARLLGVAHRLDQHDRVVRVERLAIPWTPPAVRDRLLEEELAPAAFARSLDLHARSSSSSRTKPRSPSSSHKRSATAKGSAGFTYHASAPDHEASHASCVRSSSTTITPVYGSAASRSERASAKAPIRDASSSATTISGRSRSAARSASSP